MSASTMRTLFIGLCAGMLLYACSNDSSNGGDDGNNANNTMENNSNNANNNNNSNNTTEHNSNNTNNNNVCDSMCDDGETCVEGECVADENNNPDPCADIDCGEARCEEGMCVCSGGETFEDGACVVDGCASDDDCGDGEVCNVETGACEDDGLCSDDVECGEGFVCDDAGACVEAPDPRLQTEAIIEAFFADHGGREAFPESYVEGVETLLRAEDDVVAGDYAAARERIDALFAARPLSDIEWWEGCFETSCVDGTNLGTPVAYYGLRMLDDIANVGLGDPPLETTPITMTVVLVACARGRQPTELDLTQGGRDVNLTIDPALEADDYRIIRQSVRLFQHYVWSITDGRLSLELEFVHSDACTNVYFSAAPPVSSISNAEAVIDSLSEEVRDGTDMWWVLYPSNVPDDPIFDDTAFITGGMGGYRSAPLFIIDDLWLVRKPPHLGAGLYSDLERRVYQPQWLQHEFYHHLFQRYTAFGLEASGHQWFDRDTWPDDFVGAWEPDYYAESLNKRFRGADVPLWYTLRNAPPAAELLASIPEDDVIGTYNRLPIENDYHVVRIERRDDGLWWSNDADVAWSVSYDAGVLQWAESSPYGLQDLSVELMRGQNGDFLSELVGLRLVNGGELYTRVGP